MNLDTHGGYVQVFLWCANFSLRFVPPWVPLKKAAEKASIYKTIQTLPSPLIFLVYWASSTAQYTGKNCRGRQDCATERIPQQRAVANLPPLFFPPSVVSLYPNICCLNKAHPASSINIRLHAQFLSPMNVEATDSGGEKKHYPVCAGKSARNCILTSCLR